MKNILCYGDSNTYGYNPKDASRYDENIRWSGILKKSIKAEYNVIEEGKNNRTAVVNNPAGFEFSAQRHFQKYISKAGDIEILILALGTNDLQFLYDLSFKNIEKGFENLILTAKKYKIKNIILIPPVNMRNEVLAGPFNYQFNDESISKSKNIIKVFKKLARIYNCKLFNINDFTLPSLYDGLHYDEYSHKLIAERLKDFITQGEFDE